ncbi:squalene--hopene cyclase [PVC group bacterium]|nr:squalene--hopene cyclase [PVC group bacterium]
MVKKIIQDFFQNINEALQNPVLLKSKDPNSSLFIKPNNWKELLDLSTLEEALDETIHKDLAVTKAIQKSQNYLLSLQNKDGYWCGELIVNTTIPSDYVFLFRLLGIKEPDKERKLLKHVLNNQLDDGGWNVYPNGPAEINATIKAYTTLKICGHPPNSPHMKKARKWILKRGGLDAANTFTKIYLALIGQFPWKKIPAIPSFIMLLPTWFYFNIYEISSWSRGILIPLIIIYAKKPFFQISETQDIQELKIDTEEHFYDERAVNVNKSMATWRHFFLAANTLFKFLEKVTSKFNDNFALKRAEKWILQHQEHSDGLVAIFPAMVNAILSFKALGYSNHHPAIQKELHELEKLEVDLGDSMRMQPCFSPVWDTAICSIALAESGLKRDHPSLVNACNWLVSKEVKIRGDWQIKRPHIPTAGWAFEFENQFYPDIDDTAMVILALRRIALKDITGETAREQAILRSLNWLLAMQGRDGGWAAFDVDNNKEIFTQVPFADHNALLDTSCADITARVLETLGSLGYDLSYPEIQRAVSYLKNQQEKDGSWYGRWGVNYVYGTWQVLRGLEHIGENMQKHYIQAAANWLKLCQNQDGGWGETCASYDDLTFKGMGLSTPSQTAWAVMGLISSGHLMTTEVTNGIQYLIQNQTQDGSWIEDQATGTGFPRVFYLIYTMYKDYFPLLALSTYHIMVQKALLSDQITSS